MRGMTYIHKLSVTSEEWLIHCIDNKHKVPVLKQRTSISVAITSVIFKDGVKILKKKKAKKTTA